MFHGTNDEDGTSRRTFLRGLGTAGASLSLLAGTSVARRATPTKDIEIHENLTFATREDVSSGSDPVTGLPSSHEDGELRLDLYLPQQQKPHATPLVVYIHGGQWLYGDKAGTDEVPMFKHFAREGFAVASIEYRYAWEATHPAQIIDVNTAIQWLRDHADEYNIDSENVATWGTSAGAHLAALAAVTNDVDEYEGDHASDVSSDVQAAVPWYGIMDLEQMEETAHPESPFTYENETAPESRLMGENLGDGEETGDPASPVTHLDAEDPPLLLYHGNDDRIVGYEQSVLMYERAKELCHDTTFYELHGLGHSSTDVYGALTDNPPAEATVRSTHCTPSENSPQERTKEGPVAEIEDMERFLRQNL